MKLNCIILAGTKGARKLQVNARQEYKQYLKIGRKLIIEYVIDAALNAKTIKKIFIPCDVNRIGPLVEKKYNAEHNKKIFLIREGNNIIDNIASPFFKQILPQEGYPDFNGDYSKIEDVEQYRLQNPKAENERVLFLTSDIPFLSSQDIDYFVETSKSDYDFVYGLSTQKAIKALLGKLQTNADVYSLKLGTFPIYRTAIRANNLFILKLLRVNPQLYSLSLALYNNRVLLSKTGKTNTNSWINLLRVFVRYSLGKGYRYKVTKGIFQSLLYGCFLYLALKTQKHKISSVFRQLLKQNVFEKICFNLSGGQNKATLNISNIVSSVIDVDNEEMYLFLAMNNCQNFNEISKYTYK